MHNNHRKRFRERFIKHGVDAFEEHEIIELFLYYAIPRKNTNEIAHELINKFSSISGIMDAPIDSLLEINGIGESSAVLLKLFPHMCRIYLSGKCDNKEKIIDINNVGDIFQNKFVGRTNEHSMVLLMDSKWRQLYIGELDEGDLGEVNMCIKKIIKLLLFYNANRVVIAHNHPSGFALPSKQDLYVTANIYKSLKLVNAVLLDHIIVADNDYVSLFQSGLWNDVQSGVYDEL